MNYFTKKSIIKKRILLIYALTHILVFSKNKIIAVDPSPTAMKLDFFNLVWITFWITFLAKYLHNFFLVNFRTQSQLIELFITKNCWMLVRKYGIICASLDLLQCWYAPVFQSLWQMIDTWNNKQSMVQD
jgi:hypothetical protein